jgi:hypothetical protein
MVSSYLPDDLSLLVTELKTSLKKILEGINKDPMKTLNSEYNDALV